MALSRMILMEIPPRVPMPRYTFGQRVRFDRVDCDQTGCIVGMSWLALEPGDGMSWGYHILVDDGQPYKQMELCPLVFECDVLEVIA